MNDDKIQRIIEDTGLDPIFANVVRLMYAQPHNMDTCTWMDPNACPVHSQIFIEEDPI